MSLIPRGPPGPEGPQGPTGPQGPSGPTVALSTILSVGNETGANNLKITAGQEIDASQADIKCDTLSVSVIKPLLFPLFNEIGIEAEELVFPGDIRLTNNAQSGGDKLYIDKLTPTIAYIPNNMTYNSTTNQVEYQSANPYVSSLNTGVKLLTLVDNTGANQQKQLMETASVNYNTTTNTLTAPNFSGSFNGNALTATTLQNTRTLWGQNFNGSANVSGTLSDVSSIVMGTQANKATVQYTTNTARTYTIPDAGANADFVMTAGNQSISGTKTFTSNIIGNISSATTATTSATATQANQLTTARTLWGQSFNGTANVSGNITDAGNITMGTQANKATITYPTNTARTYTVPDAGANADFVMTAGNQSIAGTKTFTSNIIGNISSATNSENTLISSITDGVLRPVVLTVSGPSGVQKKIYENTNLYYNADIQRLIAPNFGGNLTGNVIGDVLGNLTGNASSATQLQTSRRIWGQFFNGTEPITGSLSGVSSITMGEQANKATITYPANVVRTYTIPDAGANADFVMTAGNQTIAGTKTFSSDIVGNISSATTAITSGTATQANQLTTTRTLWGQNFNGTANVSGNITDAGNITMGTQTNKATITYPTNTARTYTIPDVGINSQFVMLDGAQTLPGTKTFSGGIIGNLTGTATNATNAVVTANATNANFFIPFINGTSGNRALQANADITFNPSTNILATSMFNGVLKDTQNRRFIIPSDATYNSPSATQTGYLRIKLPVYRNGSMFKMKVEFYNYTPAQRSATVYCGGYLYAPGPSVINPVAYTLCNPNQNNNLPVIFASDDTTQETFILIGESTTVWNHPNVHITEVEIGFSGFTTAWTSGWVIDYTTTLPPTIHATLTDTQVGFQATANTPLSVVRRDASGNFSAGTITASLSGNATSATTATTATQANQLTTSRNLWGNAFNGTADVNGTINIAGNLLLGNSGTSARGTLTYTATTNRTYNFPINFTAGTTADFLVSEGAQTVNGTKTFTSALTGPNIARQFDIRTLAPSDIATNGVEIGFGSFNNNNTAPYADILGLNNWTDTSGGLTNALMINKTSRNIRLYQGTFGSTSAFTTFSDVIMSDGDQTINGIKTFTSSIVGNISSATVASSATQVAITDTTTDNNIYYPTFVGGVSGNRDVRTDSATLTYNPGTNTLRTGNLSTISSITAGGNLTVNGNQVSFITAGNSLDFTRSAFSPTNDTIMFYNNVVYSQNAAVNVYQQVATDSFYTIFQHPSYYTGQGSNTFIWGFDNGYNLGVNQSMFWQLNGRTKLFLKENKEVILGGQDNASVAENSPFLRASAITFGTNLAGKNLRLGAGQGRGTGAGGAFIFDVSPAGTTGTALNNYSTRKIIDSNGNEFDYQPTPHASGSAFTLTVAVLRTRIVNMTNATGVNVTLPTGTAMEGLFNAPVDLGYDWSIICTGAGSATLLAATGHTIVGSAVVNAGASGAFRSRRTALNTWITYRIS